MIPAMVAAHCCHLRRRYFCTLNSVCVLITHPSPSLTKKQKFTLHCNPHKQVPFSLFASISKPPTTYHLFLALFLFNSSGPVWSWEVGMRKGGNSSLPFARSIFTFLCLSCVIGGGEAFSTTHYHRRPARSFVLTGINSAVSTSSVNIEPPLAKFANDVDNLATLRPPSTDADISAPFTLISAGSSYTRLWTESTWKQHSRPPHLRYSRHILRWWTSTTAREIFPTVLISVVWGTTLSFLASKFAWMRSLLAQVNGATTAVSLLTAPLALLLTLRANSSLGRLQEARGLWGRLVLHCRTLSGLLRVYLLPYAPQTTITAARHLALLGWSLKAFVRGESTESEAETFRMLLDVATTNWLIRGDEQLAPQEPAVPSLRRQPPSRTALTGRLRQLCAMGIEETEEVTGRRFTTPQLLIEEQIAALEQVVGGCERLHSSPIPPTYSRHLSRVISMFLFFMPIGIVASSSSLLGAVLISAIASYVFVGIDQVGMEIENSFSLLPLQQLASAAHVAVRDQLVCLNDAPPIAGSDLSIQ